MSLFTGVASSRFTCAVNLWEMRILMMLHQKSIDCLIASYIHRLDLQQISHKPERYGHEKPNQLCFIVPICIQKHLDDYDELKHTRDNFVDATCTSRNLPETVYRAFIPERRSVVTQELKTVATEGQLFWCVLIFAFSKEKQTY